VTEVAEDRLASPEPIHALNEATQIGTTSLPTVVGLILS
jgi:hypothetical protein